MISEVLEQAVKRALKKEGVADISFTLEYPPDLFRGDYATNVALIIAKKKAENPKDVAERIASALRLEKIDGVEKIEVAGPGFINFFLTREFFRKNLEVILSVADFGKTTALRDQKIMVEYTDPNLFKEFHIGHFMSNTIGEAIATLVEWNGAEIKRASYQGDVGLHVASAVWGMRAMKMEMPGEDGSVKQKVSFLGTAYVKGSKAYKEDERAQVEIRELNKKIFDKSDEEINELYEIGRKWSLDYFETIYARLGTKFDYYFFESVTGPRGLQIVKQHLTAGIFEESKGATIFKGEPHGLHTRVFVNKDELPTYEAKDLALALLKKETFPFDISITITGSEQTEYFKVVLKALSLFEPEIAQKIVHIPHGMLVLPTGKMSSRTGNIVTAESLIADIADHVRSKMKQESIEKEEKEKIIEAISIGAFKFMVLRQTPGKNIIFDFDASVSFEGDSGPYLQYSVVRARSLLEKAEALKKTADAAHAPNEAVALERLLHRLPETIARASKERAPQILVTYLLECAGAFNTYYGEHKIIDEDEGVSYRLALVEASSRVIENGLAALAIKVPKRM